MPTKIVGTAQVVRDAQPKQEPVAWRHVANEWADMAHNGIDYVKNIKDGITTPDEALQWLAGDLKHCREVTAAAAPTAQPLSEERIERALRYCRDVKESGTATERVVAQTVLSLLSPE